MKTTRLIPSFLLVITLFVAGRIVSAETTATLTVGVGCNYATIQEAVDAAPNGSTINVSASAVSGSDATFDITDKSLTIVGGYQFCSAATRLPTILDGLSLNGTIVEIGGASTARQVTLQNFVIKGGTNIAGDGGGISIAHDYEVNITNIKVSENSANRGAGIAIIGTLNQPEETSLVIASSTVYSNGAEYKGGGIYAEAASLTLENEATVSSNIAASYGGAVFATGGSLVDINGSDIMVSGNQAPQAGGGIMIEEGSRLDANGGYIFDNRSTGSTGGGGVYAVDEGTTFLIENSEIVSNSAASGGGLMADFGAVGTIRGSSVISGNVAEYDYSGQKSGGGIYATGSGTVVTISGGAIVRENTAANGGGVALKSGAKVVLLDSAEIISNTAQTGGGVYLRYSTLLAEGAQNSRPSLSENASIGWGGAIYARSSSTISLNMVDLISNTAGTGGGLYAASSTAFLTNTHLAGNNQYTVYLNSSEGTIAAEFKSALQPLGCDPALLPDGRYCSHFDQNLGSAISVGSGSNLKLSHTAITRNSGTHPARDVTVNLSGFDATATFDTVLLAHNEDDVSIGIDVSADNQIITAAIRNSTIVSNSGTPISTDEQSVVTIQRSVFWGNELGSQIENQTAFSSDCNVVQATYPNTAPFIGQGDISTNPMLTGDGYLSSNSPAIDACEDDMGFDITGRLRSIDGNGQEDSGEFDMGAFEFDPTMTPMSVGLMVNSAESTTANRYVLTVGLLLVTAVTWGLCRHEISMLMPLRAHEPPARQTQDG